MNMRKFIIGIIALVIIVGVLVCSHDEGYQINDWSWKEKKVEQITWEKLDTFVFESYGFKVEYPNTFWMDTTESEVDFLYAVDDELILMRCYTFSNDDKWDVETAADSIAAIRKEIRNDSVVMKDLHPDYFYLKFYNDEKELRSYDQYVVDKDVIYVYELCYPKVLEDRMRNLMDLVHNWDPKPWR